MQTLNVTVLGSVFPVYFSGSTSDDRGRMWCDSEEVGELVETIATDQDDGRGVLMGGGVFTAAGVAAALRVHGYEVDGVEVMPPDMDGIDE